MKLFIIWFAFASLLMGMSSSAFSAPNPKIKHVESKAEVGFTRHYFEVANWSMFPDRLFKPSPNLPPCGLNTNSSRTWVDIYNARTNKRLYGFCALSDNEHLKSLWVAQRSEGCLKIRIVLNDRLLRRKYVSNVLRLPCIIN